MYLRTPKRYTRYGRKRHLISLRWLWLWILAPIVIFVGVGIYQNRDMVAPHVNQALEGVVKDTGERIATVNAPPPTPTQDPTSDIQRADEAWRRGAIQEAVNLYQRAASGAPNDLAVHYRLTLGLIMQGQLEQALVAAENAVTARPFSPDSWAIRAMALNRLGRNGEAIASAQRALELAPSQNIENNPGLAMSHARAQAFLAEAYLNAAQYERARTIVDQAIETYPDSFEAYQVRGRIRQEVDFDFVAALADFQQAYDLAPNMVYVTIWLARTEQRLENYPVSLELYQDIIENNPGNTLALYELGTYYFRVQGDYNQAASFFSRCVEANPNSNDCHYMLGRSEMNLGQILDAQESFQTAYNLNAEVGGGFYHYWVAESYIQLAQCSQAMPYLRSGYQIALERQDDRLIGPFELSLQECGSPVVTPVPEGEEDEDTEPETGGADV